MGDDDDDAFFGRQYVAMESTTTTTTEGNNDTDDDDGNIDMIENPSSPTTGGIDDNDSTLEPLLLSTPSLSSSSSTLSSPSSVSSSVILCGVRAYKALPSFYFRQMWPYGMTCGAIWSIGNFCSILSVEFLGEGIGYASTQAAMLISGVWGIFYFREIEGTNAISKWLLCASCTVLGILILSYEHHEP